MQVLNKPLGQTAHHGWVEYANPRKVCTFTKLDSRAVDHDIVLLQGDVVFVSTGAGKGTELRCGSALLSDTIRF